MRKSPAPPGMYTPNESSVVVTGTEILNAITVPAATVTLPPNCIGTGAYPYDATTVGSETDALTATSGAPAPRTVITAVSATLLVSTGGLTVTCTGVAQLPIGPPVNVIDVGLAGSEVVLVSLIVTGVVVPGSNLSDTSNVPVRPSWTVRLVGVTTSNWVS